MSDDKPPVESTDDRSIDWRIARFGAFAALAGTAVGSLASVVIAWWGFEREEDASNRAAEEEAYVEFLTKADAFVYRFRYDGLALSNETPKLDEIDRLQSLIALYGDADVLDASNAMINGITTGLGIRAKKAKDEDKGEDEDAAWAAYDDARVDFIYEVQDALEINR